MRFLLILLLLALGALPRPAEAATAIMGKALLAWCESDKMEDQSACIGYLLGIGDILSDQTVYQGRACLTGTISGEDLRKLYILFLRVNPQLAENTSGANIAALAMMEAFPCKDKPI